MLKTVTVNRKAYRDYAILRKYEAGIKLTGAEVKSVREGRVSLRGGYVKVVGGEPFLVGAKIDPYAKARVPSYDAKRTRKLLLQKREIGRLLGLGRQKGWAVVPLKLYFKDNIAKLELGLGRGKRKYEKRQKLKGQDVRRQVEHELAEAEKWG